MVVYVDFVNIYHVCRFLGFNDFGICGEQKLIHFCLISEGLERESVEIVEAAPREHEGCWRLPFPDGGRVVGAGWYGGAVVEQYGIVEYLCNSLIRVSIQCR